MKKQARGLRLRTGLGPAIPATSGLAASCGGMRLAFRLVVRRFGKRTT